MKVLIIDTAPKERATYLNNYIEICRKNNIDYQRLIWDRTKDGKVEYKETEIIYHGKCPDGGVSKLKKIYPLYKYRNALKRIILAGNYTHLILVNTIAPVILSGLIRNHFKERYIMDVRDYTYEKYSFYKSRVDALIEDSAFSVISSEGFYRFLNRNPKIVIAHNISNLDDACSSTTLSASKPNTIGFAGYVRYKNENWELIETLANSHSYRLLYAGDVMAGCNLEELCQQKQIHNVKFMGRFDNQKKGQIYKNVDMINSLYGDFSLEVTTAIPNRYYDALIYKKPILASKGTFLGKLVEEKKLGISVDIFKDDVKMLLDQYISDFKAELFEKRCQWELDVVLKEQQIYINKIVQFLSQGNQS